MFRGGDLIAQRKESLDAIVDVAAARRCDRTRCERRGIPRITIPIDKC